MESRLQLLLHYAIAIMVSQTLRFPVIVCIVASISMTSLDSAYGEGLVSGSYLSASGKTIVLRLSIATPAPANLIVETTVPATAEITATSPPARKISNDSGKIKWLFKNSRSGELSLSATLAAPVEGPVVTVVRYRSPVDGTFHEFTIFP